MGLKHIRKTKRHLYPQYLARRKLSTFLLGLILAPNLLAETTGNQAPWFGVQLPPPMDDKAPVLLAPRSVASVKFADNEQQYPELLGDKIMADVATIVGFSQHSRQSKEIGAGQIWGRISGFPSGAKTVQWAANQLREAGIAKVALQTLQQDSDSRLWLPLSWSVTLLGNESLGDGKDILLDSAMPLAPSQLPPQGITAPVVSAGNGSGAATVDLNVRDKIVIQRVIPQGHMVFERGPTRSQAQRFFQDGALAVINIVDLPGNLRALDFSNCGGPCFNLGGRDGRFLLEVLDKAAEHNVLDKVSLSLQLKSQVFTDLQAQNAVAIIAANPDSVSANENIVINAHADAWFDGAGDNGDGLAVMLALARHFATQPALNRTLVFVASAGHHTSGLNGPRNLVAQNAELMNNTQVIINIEHIAQRNIAPARVLYDDGYRQFTADSTEAPIVAGISNRAPLLEKLIAEGIDRFGVNFVSASSDMASGEGGGYRQLNKAIVTTMQAPPLYHTSGESIDMISVPGLERMAHFLADFIRQIAEAPGTALNPAIGNNN